MKYLKSIFVASTLCATAALSTQVTARDAALCDMAKQNLVHGGQKYGKIFNKMVSVLQRSDVSFYHYKLGSCSKDGRLCGPLPIDVWEGLEPNSMGNPSVAVTPRSGANDGDAYYVFGRLSGYILHKQCGNDTHLLNGHSWAIGYTAAQIQRKMNRKTIITTSLSKAGHMVAKDYKPTITAFTTGYRGDTVVVRFSEFRGKASAFGQFVDLFAELENASDY